MSEENKQNTPIIHKFEIALYEEITNDNGDVIGQRQVQSPEPIIVEAASPQELNAKLKTYSALGQKVKVLREIDPPKIEQNTQTPKVNAQQNKPVQIIEDKKIEVRQHVHQPVIEKRPIKFYRVGDIEIKDDNGKIYQKQWMKLSDIEASNLRVINDKNNAIVNLAGKHIEMKKWILVETIEDDTASLEDNLK